MGEPENYDPKEFIYRVGTFFLLVGIGLLVFFMLSESADQPQFNYFCGSMVLLILGFMFRAQYRKAVASSGRFGWVKKLLNRGGGGEEEDDE
jgi:positive regulator of sigma E activity